MTFSAGYIIISIIIAVTDLYIGGKVYTLNKKYSRMLGYTCFAAACTNMLYLISVLSTSYQEAIAFSSLYYFSIDVLLNCLAFFIWHNIRTKPSKYVRCLAYLSLAYMAFDFVMFLVNYLTESIFYLDAREAEIAQFYVVLVPKMAAFSYLHLIYSYIIVLLVLAGLTWKIFTVPKEYRPTYFFAALSIWAIVIINAGFLFLPDTGLWCLLDLSILGYGVAAFLLYWCFYGYTRRSMLSQLNNRIFENVDEGIILFDYEDLLIMNNQKAEQLFNCIDISEGRPLKEFIEDCGIRLKGEGDEEDTTTLCYVPDGKDESMHPLRCDYRRIYNSHGEHIGTVCVFVDARMRTDLLTGFHYWEEFKNYVVQEMDESNPHLVVGMCDITGLALINNAEGQSAGDKALKDLADCLRSNFGQEAYYIRGRDADMIMLFHNLTEKEVLQRFEKVAEQYARSIEFTTSVVDDEHPGVSRAIIEADHTLNNKKLLNKESIHHSTMKSLLRALQECDNDTEAHVRRTQMLARALAERLQLSNKQISDLMLLALLHDIGKIGVPLEILNKPGRLDDNEWATIKSHVEKGYQIAMSAKDLEGIADMIRHHHERWDGAGYPDGLAKESIPILSRIIAVVDAYDAMVCNRSYRVARSVEAAVEELKKNAGTQFDPLITSCFAQMLQECPELAYSQVPAKLEKMPTSENRRLSTEVEAQPGQTVHPLRYARYYLDESTYILNVDPLFTELTGYTQQDIDEKKMMQIDLIPKEDRTTYLCALDEQLASRRTAFFEHRIVCKNGTTLDVLCTGHIYFDYEIDQPRSEILIVSSSDTVAVKNQIALEQSKEKIRMEKWEKIYRHDAMTGLLSRSAYAADVEQALLNKNQQLVFLMLDVDRFKQFNDTYGHHAGDEFLIAFANAVRDTLREEDLVCRMGGDEFSATMLFPPEFPVSSIERRVQEIFESVREKLQSLEHSTGFSMGVAVSNDELNSFPLLYEAADNALYEGKDRGRDCVILTTSLKS